MVINPSKFENLSSAAPWMAGRALDVEGSTPGRKFIFMPDPNVRTIAALQLEVGSESRSTATVSLTFD